MKQIKKRMSFELKSATLEGNCLKGHAAVCGNLDRGFDVIYPGAFDDALAGFLSAGFVADNHDWTKQIGMPTVARMEGSKLYTEMEFHSTQDAQDLRTKCQERLEHNLSVGLSVGFSMETENYQYFKSGADLLADATASGCDMKLFDQAALRAHKGWCRAIKKVEELFEYSTASVPMNPEATATSVKGLSLKDWIYVDDTDLEIDPFDGIEESMTMDAFDTLRWRLYSMVSRAVRSDKPLPERLTALDATFDSFKTLAMKLFSALLTEENAEEAKAFSLALKRRLQFAADRDPDELPETSPIAKDNHADSVAFLCDLAFTQHSAAVGLAVADLKRRTSWVRELRTNRKAGRQHSRATRDKLQTMHDDLSATCVTLKEMLESCDEDGGATVEEQKALQRQLKLATLCVEAGL